jgi:hypothetical protein
MEAKRRRARASRMIAGSLNRVRWSDDSRKGRLGGTTCCILRVAGQRQLEVQKAQCALPIDEQRLWKENKCQQKSQIGPKPESLARAGSASWLYMDMHSVGKLKLNALPTQVICQQFGSFCRDKRQTSLSLDGWPPAEAAATTRIYVYHSPGRGRWRNSAV